MDVQRQSVIFRVEYYGRGKELSELIRAAPCFCNQKFGGRLIIDCVSCTAVIIASAMGEADPKTPSEKAFDKTDPEPKS